MIHAVMHSLGHKPLVKLTHLDISAELVLIIHLTAVLHMYISHHLIVAILVNYVNSAKII